MEERQRVHGTAELTPAKIRAARFPTSPEGYDRRAVLEFLEQVATSYEVLASQDNAEALRRELQRSSEISSRMVLAGQEAAERLRQQAAEDAQSILDDTRHLASQLRNSAKEEVERSSEHVERMQHAFVEELRDMYDRIGATLFRFENALDVASSAAGANPNTSAEHSQMAPPTQQTAPPPIVTLDEIDDREEAAENDEWLAPAWTQLPSQAFDAATSVSDEFIDEEESGSAHASSEAAVLPSSEDHGTVANENVATERDVVELDDHVDDTYGVDAHGSDATQTAAEVPAISEPLDPNEPLVDLRPEAVAKRASAQPEPQEMQWETVPTPPAPAVDGDGEDISWLMPEPVAQVKPPIAEPAASSAADDEARAAALLASMPPITPSPTEVSATEPVTTEAPEPVDEIAAPEPAQTAPTESVLPETAPAETTPEESAPELPVAVEMPVAVEPPAPPPTSKPAPLPAPPSLEPDGGNNDPAFAPALQTFILEALHEGQPRAAIERWIAEQHGIANPQEVVDAALAQQSDIAGD